MLNNRLVTVSGFVLIAGFCVVVVSGMRGQDSEIDRAVTLAEMLQENVIDLTHTFDENTIYWPTDEDFHHQRTRWGRDQGDWYASATYSASEHGGTHLDSPIHFAEGGATTDRIPVQRMIGPAVVIDVIEECAADPDYLLQVKDLTEWEDQHGRIPNGAVVLMHTGFGAYWPDKKRYLGTDEPDDVENLHFPGFGPEASEWLVGERKISGVGLDTASLDHGPSRDFRAHRILNGAGLFGLENVAHLDRLPPAGAVLIALPMKIGGGSGGPVRIVAILPIGRD